MASIIVDPVIQKIYDEMSPEERTTLDAELVAKGLTLADLLPTKPRSSRDPPRIDRRCLSNTHSKASQRLAKAKAMTRAKRARDGLTGKFEPKRISSGPEIPKGEGLKGKDLQKYIVDSLGDGRELADFYLGILRMAGVEAMKNGVWLKHRMDAAAWLGERGWGKPKGDNDEKGGINIVVQNYADAQIAQAPQVRTVDGTVNELELKGPAKFDAVIIEEKKFISEPKQQQGLVNGEAKETKTPIVLERLDENFQLEEIDVSADETQGPPRRTITGR